MITVRSLKIATFSAASLPAVALALQAFDDGLGANPVETLTHATGDWALRLLLVTLAVTPLRNLTGWYQVMHLRRMLGLFAFFYASMHLSVYLVFDHLFDWRGMVADVLERPYITAGLTAFTLLIPLAVTSTNGWMRRLGKNWTRLHRLVYPAAVIAVVHFLWLVKADLLEPLIYAAVLTCLFALRALPSRKRGSKRRPRRQVAGSSSVQSQ